MLEYMQISALLWHNDKTNKQTNSLHTTQNWMLNMFLFCSSHTQKNWQNNSHRIVVNLPTHTQSMYCFLGGWLQTVWPGFCVANEYDWIKIDKMTNRNCTYVHKRRADGYDNDDNNDGGYRHRHQCHQPIFINTWLRLAQDNYPNRFHRARWKHLLTTATPTTKSNQ